MRTKPLGNTEQKAPQELVCTDGHRSGVITPRVVLPPECHLAILESNEPVIGDCNTMRISGKVLQDVPRAFEGPLCINDPLMPEELPQETAEQFRIGETSQ